MPELPEVEAARRALEKIAKGRTISKVSVYEDPIVFSGVTHASFATAIEGKDVREVRRKGKQFYMVLDSGPHPLFHFGMAGYSQTKGESGPSYRVPRATTDPLEWPPKYAKVCITFSDADGKEVGKWAFSDARRLGRVKLITAEVPEEGETLSSLGRDPLLDMIPVAELSVILTKRNAPIKAVLLDQNGPIAGLGNWMVDEILYQSQLHPSHPASALTVDDVATLHKQILEVTLAAVEANADSDLFPKHWLFSSRWGKGKNGKDKFILPSGEETSITFMTVAGRTSAVVEAVQKLPAGVKIKAKKLAKKRKVEEEVSEGEPVPADEIETESPHFKRRMTSLVSASPEGSPSRTPATFKLPLASPSRHVCHLLALLAPHRSRLDDLHQRPLRSQDHGRPRRVHRPFALREPCVRFLCFEDSGRSFRWHLDGRQHDPARRRGGAKPCHPPVRCEGHCVGTSPSRFHCRCRDACSSGRCHCRWVRCSRRRARMGRGQPFARGGHGCWSHRCLDWSFPALGPQPRLSQLFEVKWHKKMSYASSHARSESEVELASLHLHLPFTPPRQRSVMISIEDLEFPPLSLGKSVVEEEEEQHLGAALRALSLLNQSPTPSPPRTGANSPASSAAFSPCPLSPLPDAPFDNYFHLSRPLYSEGRFLSFGSSRSASSSSSTPRSGYSSSSSFGSSSAASSCGPATPEASTPDMSARAPPSIASRRKKAPKDSFALDLSSVSAALALAAPGRTTHGFADGRGDVVGAGAEGICRSRSSQGNGLLKNNFGGISVSTAVVDALEGPLTPHLRPRRSHGFAF